MTQFTRFRLMRHGARPLGALLIMLSVLAIDRLLPIGHADAGHEPAIVYGLALAAFLTASLGAALSVHGAHLFDQIPIADRWRHRDV